MIKLTFDTNCLIDVDEGRPAATAVLDLVKAGRDGHVDVALVASSASERQRSGEFLENITFFRERARTLGFGDMPLLPPLARWGISFWDSALYASEEDAAREQNIYRTMFPASPYAWADFAILRGTTPNNTQGPEYLRWRNQILDAQAFWAHVHHERNVFVTSDARFNRLENASHLGRTMVRTPPDALAALYSTI